MQNYVLIIFERFRTSCCISLTNFKKATILLEIVTSRTGIISALCKKGDKRDIEKCRPIYVFL